MEGTAEQAEKTKPRIYVLVEGKLGISDVAGSLWDDRGVHLWGHVSSSPGFLKGDLTTTFRKRRETLDEKYPDGYEVAVIEGRDTDGVYEELAAIWDRTVPGWREGKTNG